MEGEKKSTLYFSSVLCSRGRYCHSQVTMKVSILIFIFSCRHVHMCMTRCEFVYLSTMPTRGREGVRPRGTGVEYGYNPLDVSAGN